MLVLAKSVRLVIAIKTYKWKREKAIGFGNIYNSNSGKVADSFI